MRRVMANLFIEFDQAKISKCPIWAFFLRIHDMFSIIVATPPLPAQLYGPSIEGSLMEGAVTGLCNALQPPQSVGLLCNGLKLAANYCNAILLFYELCIVI